MTKFKKTENLLVAVDLSDFSRTVAKQAFILAKKMAVPLTFIYVFKDSEISKDSFKIHRTAVVKYYTQLIQTKYNVPAASLILVKFGDIHQQIIAAAEKLKAPLIVIGHRGTNPVVRFFMGSTAKNLSQYSPFPVWIHRSDSVMLPKKVLIPCDLSERFKHCDSLLKAFGATAELFHVKPEPMPILDYPSYAAFAKQIEKNEIAKTRKFRKKYPQIKIVREVGGVVSSIEDRLEKFDMIALSPRSSSKLQAFFGSVSAKLLNTGTKPILIAR